MKISTKLAFAAVMLVVCSPTAVSAEEIVASNSMAASAGGGENFVVKDAKDSALKSEQPIKSAKKSDSKKSLLGILSLLFTSII